MKRSVTWTIVAVAVAIAAAVAGLFVAWPRHQASPPPDLVPSSWATFRASKGHELHVGQRNIECGACHDYRKVGFARVELASCGKCHENQAARSHHGGAGKETTCLTCHSFSPESPPACAGCHGEKHASGAASLVTVHSSLACDECHHVHDRPSITDAECLRCHDAVKLSHAGRAGSAACRDCHHAHDSAKKAPETCGGCHASPKGPKPAGHDSCLGCHAPHDFRSSGPKVCASCHAKQTTLVSAITVEHRSCTSCHEHHDPGRAAGACRSCHSAVQHAEHGGKKNCTSCHEPHGGNADVAVVACTSCHQKIASSDRGAHAAGQECTVCHAAPGFALADRKTLCASCHARQIKLVTENHAHEECTACHGSTAHQPKAAPPCAACHARERATAPAGHQQCTTCHDAHGATVPPLQTCVSCHKKESATQHGGLPGGCRSCHLPHGDSHKPAVSLTPPPCASCHVVQKLPGLHAVAQHLACGKCHEAHGPPRADRTTCTGACHADKREHEKEATACSGCHVFAR